MNTYRIHSNAYKKARKTHSCGPRRMRIPVSVRFLQDKDDWLHCMNCNQPETQYDVFNDLLLSQDITQRKEVAENSEAPPWPFSLILRDME